MIGSLSGVLLDRDANGEVLVDVHGVGYRATVPASTLVALGELGSPVFLHVHTHVREDAITLYGFATGDERRCFEALLGAHGVGPSMALAILSVHTPTSLRRALATDDIAALTVVSGVGRKTAARLMLELKSRLDVDLHGDVSLVAVGSAVPASPLVEVRAALAELGYEADVVTDVCRGLPEDGAVEDLLRNALRQLATAR